MEGAIFIIILLGSYYEVPMNNFGVKTSLTYSVVLKYTLNTFRVMRDHLSYLSNL